MPGSKPQIIKLSLGKRAQYNVISGYLGLTLKASTRYSVMKGNTDRRSSIIGTVCYVFSVFSLYTITYRCITLSLPGGLLKRWIDLHSIIRAYFNNTLITVIFNSCSNFPLALLNPKQSKASIGTCIVL